MMSTTPLIALAWDPVRAAPPLSRDGLHLWSIDLGSGGGDADRLWQTLSPDERFRADRLSISERREAHIRAHARLREILALYLKTNPQALVFTIGETGKPALDGEVPHLHFNLTTSADLALLGISHTPLGVDCERLDQRRDLVAIARRMFPCPAADAVAAAQGAERVDHFYRAWTALEAEVKADGRGLGRRISAPDSSPPLIRHCIPRPGFIAAVARTALPPVRDWQAFCLADPFTGGSET